LSSQRFLFFRTTHVPVGEDQLQHIQLAQHLAKIFNNKFGNTFPMCQPVVAEDASSRIKSLRDPSKKMSKSDPDTKSCIMITDTPELIVEKVKKAVTDFKSEVTYEADQRPGVTNLLTIHSMVSGKSIQEICDEAKHLDTGK
jgi:tryptophanyl-tRNA synthetase